MVINDHLCSRYVDVLSTDLNAFAEHAKRKQINPVDVLMCVRRNPELHAKLEKEMPPAAAAPKKRSKKNASTATTAAPVAEDE